MIIGTKLLSVIFTVTPIVKSRVTNVVEEVFVTVSSRAEV